MHPEAFYAKNQNKDFVMPKITFHNKNVSLLKSHGSRQIPQ
jgi:hypothetical protein